MLKPLLLALLIGLIPTISPAAPAAPSAGNLKEIQQAISAAQSDLNQKKAAQQKARQTIDHTGAALNEARQQLAGINKQQHSGLDKLQKLQNELGRLKTEVTGTKAQVARLLSGHYKNRQPNAVALFLKNAEPGQKDRYLQYTRYINQANEKVMADLVKQQQELSVREKEIDVEVAKLNKLKASKQSIVNKLGRDNSAALRESNRLSSQIDQQTKHIAGLKANEQRLNSLLADLARKEAAKRRAEAAERKKAAEERIAKSNKEREEQIKKAKGKPVKNIPAPAHTVAPIPHTPAPKAPVKSVPPTPKTPTSPRSTLTAEDRSLSAPSENHTESGFSTMQGRLTRPVGGSIHGRFGQEKPSGGTWRGVFFATGSTGVHSIASGIVAHAGPLSGYGNIVIVDHGSGYVSVYSGLSSISVASGSHVSAGSTLGTSGSLPSGEQGLYLEIRYHGQPMNPLSWIR